MSADHAVAQVKCHIFVLFIIDIIKIEGILLVN
jgi:hypothetical protein